MMDEQSRVWPVFIEIRDAVKAVLAPPLSIGTLIRRGPKIARRLRQGCRRRKMQRSNLNRIFSKSLG
jgi:hypothetical protein